MANQALAVLENALRARKLDRTLTTALPPIHHHADASTLTATGVSALDACLRGGLPRGQLSEIAGPRSSGRTLLLLQMLAAATHRGEIVALVDTFDRFDVASAVSAGVNLDRLLWIRGDTISHGGSSPQGSHGGVRPQASHGDFRLQSSHGGFRLQAEDRAIDRALKALNLVLQAGGFGVVAIDLADATAPALARMPLTTWLRVQRTIEGSDTACVIVAAQPLARSARGVTLSLAGRVRWNGHADRSRHLAGMDVSVRVVSPRRWVDGDVTFSASTSDSHLCGPQRHSDTEAETQVVSVSL